jgi:hypothetical protein
VSGLGGRVIEDLLQIMLDERKDGGIMERRVVYWKS